MLGVPMRTTYCLAVLGPLFTAAMLGCEAPRVIVQHTLPPALDVPAEALTVDPADFVVTSGQDGTATAFVAKMLKRRLKTWTPFVLEGISQTEAQGAGRVEGKIHIEQTETKGSRWVRREEAKTGRLRREKIPTLVRTGMVRITFVVRSAETGEQLVAADISRPYSSADDPRVRDKGGQGRPDDPERIPSADQIVNELLADCVGSFCQMIRPMELRVQVQFRPAAGQRAEEGLAAVSWGMYEKALVLFDEALRTDPANPAIMFNLAAVAELTGRDETALRFYQAVLKRAKGRDRPAKDAVIRLTNVLARRKSS